MRTHNQWLHSWIQAEGEWVDEMLVRRAGWRGRKFHHLRLLDVRLSHTRIIQPFYSHADDLVIV